MKIQTSEVRAICNNTGRQQNAGKIAVVVMTSRDHAAMHETARLDIEKIAQAAGVEMLKTARIVARRGIRQQQETGLKELNILLQDIREAKDHESVLTKTGIATGYANAMHHFDLISESELNDVIEVIGQTGKRTTRHIEAANRPFGLGIFRKWVRA